MTELKVFPIQARWFLLLWFVPYFFDPMQLMFDIYLAAKLAGTIYPSGNIPDYVFDFSYYYFNAARTMTVIVLLALITRTSLTRFISPFDTKTVSYTHLTLPTKA